MGEAEHECARVDAGFSAEFSIEELSAATEAGSLRAARELLLEYGRFVVAQPAAARFCFGSLEREANDLPMSFAEQGGGCLLAWVRGEPAGFVAWRAIPESALVAPGSWELKRLWVRPAGRGLGLGRLLTQAVLDRAIAARRSAVYLDTAPEAMASAYRLYVEMGFVPCRRYNNNPVEGLAFMVKFF
jgi:ribosomal protein S18 acetylase RimI-like enzyme